MKFIPFMLELNRRVRNEAITQNVPIEDVEIDTIDILSGDENEPKLIVTIFGGKFLEVYGE